MSLMKRIKMACLTLIAVGVVGALTSCGGEEQPEAPNWEPMPPQQEPAQPLSPEDEPQEEESQPTPTEPAFPDLEE